MKFVYVLEVRWHPEYSMEFDSVYSSKKKALEATKTFTNNDNFKVKLTKRRMNVPTSNRWETIIDWTNKEMLDEY